MTLWSRGGKALFASLITSFAWKDKLLLKGLPAHEAHCHVSRPYVDCTFLTGTRHSVIALVRRWSKMSPISIEILLKKSRRLFARCAKQDVADAQIMGRVTIVFVAQQANYSAHCTSTSLRLLCAAVIWIGSTSGCSFSAVRTPPTARVDAFITVVRDLHNYLPN